MKKRARKDYSPPLYRVWPPNTLYYTPSSPPTPVRVNSPSPVSVNGFAFPTVAQQTFTDTKTFKSHLSKLLDDPTFSDVTLIVKGDSNSTNNNNNNNNNTEFHAHRAILSARSEVFSKMFLTGFKEAKQKEIVLEEVSPTAMSTLLQFLYTGEMELTIFNIFEIIPIADRFLISDALKACSDFLAKQITKTNIFSLLQPQLEHIVTILNFQKPMVAFITKNFKDLWTSDHFTELPFEMVLKLVESDNLCVSSEFSVFNAIAKWAGLKLLPEMPTTLTYIFGEEVEEVICLSEETEGNKAHIERIPELLVHIRFPTMSTFQLNTIENSGFNNNSVIKDMLIEAWKFKAGQSDGLNVRYKEREGMRSGGQFYQWEFRDGWTE